MVQLYDYKLTVMATSVSAYGIYSKLVTCQCVDICQINYEEAWRLQREIFYKKLKAEPLSVLEFCAFHWWLNIKTWCWEIIQVDENKQVSSRRKYRLSRIRNVRIFDFETNFYKTWKHISKNSYLITAMVTYLVTDTTRSKLKFWSLSGIVKFSCKF